MEEGKPVTAKDWKKYSVVTKETVKRLRFVPAKFEVEEEITYVYSCPKCGAMKRPEKNLP